ncbi:hypothetical protein HOP50_04g28770 [Chloropicon primus]|uniref:Uncharacterized protein n=1 Tax=Chloropicon primus TaxID=1764295 RepID=A0A5B8MJA7_9CHLO|nr:hypothetical protein A3770_04p28790 [Chloropicon primus]UPQ99569.1 hypothetical protein HOP50_04g28770 [Chloropicon primus]|eukprot:QDZ20361.1 hypothetical protein A3770_04p28790 [Chloropicon primus]
MRSRSSRQSGTMVVEPSEENPLSQGRGRSEGATYFSQDHEFKVDFDHAFQGGVAGRTMLGEWVTNPGLLLVASYGEDNVRRAEGDESQQEEDEGTSVWHVTLPKVKIFSWQVQPSFDISATVMPNGIVFTSKSIVLDGTNIPDSLKSTQIEFSLFSQLYLEDEDAEGESSERVQGRSSMIAQNALTLGVYLPKRLSRLPGVKRTGNIIVRTILNSVDRSAKNKLVMSFQNYRKSREMGRSDETVA